MRVGINRRVKNLKYERSRTVTHHVPNIALQYITYTRYRLCVRWYSCSYYSGDVKLLIFAGENVESCEGADRTAAAKAYPIILIQVDLDLILVAVQVILVVLLLVPILLAQLFPKDLVQRTGNCNSRCVHSISQSIYDHRIGSFFGYV